MRRLLVLAVLLGAQVSPSAAQPPSDLSGERVIVGVEPRVGGTVELALRTAGVHVVRQQPGSLIVADLPWGVTRASIERVAGVRFVEPDIDVSIDATAPNDPSWPNQWAHGRISLPEAWDVTSGSDQVVVGVVDSGIDLDHPDLRDRLWVNPAETSDGRDDDGNGFVDDVHGADCRDGGEPQDEHDHGTHVAGIIGASADNGVGIAGVDWGVRLMALRFLGPEGRGRLSDAIRCLDYAVAMGAHITNHSWGTSARSTALEEALGRAQEAGMLVVSSAGNDGLDLDAGHPHYPSSFEHDNIVAVAATTSHDGLTPWSNYGAHSVDIAAPGSGILSTVQDGYAHKGGTSMAAPHVAGAAALVLAAHPGIGYREVIERLLRSVDRTRELEPRLRSGGRLHVARALDADTAAPARPVLHNLTSLRTRTSLTVAWLAPDEDGRRVGAAPVSRYHLLVRERGQGSWRSVPAPWPMPPGTPQEARIEGLSLGGVYDVVLIAIDNVGNAMASAPIRASTSSR